MSDMHDVAFDLAALGEMMARLRALGGPDAERLAEDGERLLDESRTLIADLKAAERRLERGESVEEETADIMSHWADLFARLVAHLRKGQALVARRRKAEES